MVRIAPKSFDPVNMIPWLPSTHKRLEMIDRMMFAIPFQGLIPTKRIRVIDGPLPGFGLDMPHELFGTHRFNDFGIHTGFPLQEPKDDTFASRGSAFASPCAFAPKSASSSSISPLSLPPSNSAKWYNASRIR
jgi:hypothetical protein